MAYTPPIVPVASTVNSTTTPLTAGATFTGTWEVAASSSSTIAVSTTKDIVLIRV